MISGKVKHTSVKFDFSPFDQNEILSNNAQLLKSFEFGKGSKMSNKKLVIFEKKKKTMVEISCKK